MSLPARTHRQPPAIIIVPIIILVIGLIIYLISSIVPIELAGQFYLIVAALLAFRYWPPMIRWVKAMPVPHRLVLGVLLAALILGHLTLRPRTWFPFTAWAIFPVVREEDPVVCPEFIATTQNGRQVRLLVEQLMPSIVQIDPLDDPQKFPPQWIDHLAQALAQSYNRRHADDPVRQIDLMLMAVHLHPPTGEIHSQPSCKLLKHYEISSAPSN